MKRTILWVAAASIAGTATAYAQSDGHAVRYRHLSHHENFMSAHARMGDGPYVREPGYIAAPGPYYGGGSYSYGSDYDKANGRSSGG